MAFKPKRFYTPSEAADAIMTGKPLTNKQQEAKLKREQKEAEFRLKCSIIDEIKEYPVLYDKADPSHFKHNCKEEIYERIGSALDMKGKRIY